MREKSCSVGCHCCSEICDRQKCMYLLILDAMVLSADDRLDIWLAVFQESVLAAHDIFAYTFTIVNDVLP